MLRIFFGLLLKLCHVILSAFPIAKKNHFVLGCSSGSTINGNAKALFYFSMNNRCKVDGHLFLRNKALVRMLQESYPDNVHYSYSLKALMLFVTAKALVITHGVYDLAPFSCTKRNQKLINIWHGFPIKHLGIDDNSLTEQQKINALGNFDGLITMSEEERQIMSRAYKTEISNVWVTGYPRNDEMLKPTKRLANELPYTEGKRVILYAPTYRDNGTTKLFPFENFDLDKFDKFLKQMNAIILLRVHKNELAKHNLKETNNIRVCDSSVIPEMNDFLADISILVTDYSSIYIDILLIDKPMISNCSGECLLKKLIGTPITPL